MMQWLESIPWFIIPTAVIALFAVLGFYWTYIPDEKKYWWYLRLGQKRPSLSIKKAGGVKSHDFFTKWFIHLINSGLKVPYDVELEIWEPTDRWTVRLEDGQWITGNAKKVTDAGGATEDNPRWNKYLLSPPDERKQIGHVDVKTSWQGPASDEEYFRWRLSCLGVKIAEGLEKVPLQRRES